MRESRSLLARLGDPDRSEKIVYITLQKNVPGTWTKWKSILLFHLILEVIATFQIFDIQINFIQ